MTYIFTPRPPLETPIKPYLKVKKWFHLYSACNANMRNRGWFLSIHMKIWQWEFMPTTPISEI